MGFRSGVYATVWDVKPISDTMTSVRLSTSRKNKNTGKYEQDFSSFVGFIGRENAAKATKLNRKDRIKIGDTDVSNSFSNNGGERTFFNVFSFELINSNSSNSSNSSKPSIDDGEVEIDEDSLPF